MFLRSTIRRKDGKEHRYLSVVTDGRELKVNRCSQPEPELMLLPDRLKLELPQQSPPKITPAKAAD